MDYRNFESHKRCSAFGKIDNSGENFGRVQIIKLSIVLIAWTDSGIFIDIVKIVEIVNVQDFVNRLTTVAAKDFLIEKKSFLVDFLTAVKALFCH
jgi:hypothetical protein